MGARVSIADNPAPLGYSTPRVVTRDEHGGEVVREQRGPAPTELEDDVLALLDPRLR